jgi:hypothetical protein
MCNETRLHNNGIRGHLVQQISCSHKSQILSIETWEDLLRPSESRNTTIYECVCRTQLKVLTFRIFQDRKPNQPFLIVLKNITLNHI